MQPITCPKCLNKWGTERDDLQAILDDDGMPAVLEEVERVHRYHKSDRGPFDSLEDP